MTAERDHQAEQDHAEFTGWAEAQGYGDERYDFEEMEFAFTSGMQAAGLGTAWRLLDQARADLDQLRERVARTAAKLDADALVSAPSKKSEIQRETAARLRETLGDQA